MFVMVEEVMEDSSVSTVKWLMTASCCILDVVLDDEEDVKKEIVFMVSVLYVIMVFLFVCVVEEGVDKVNFVCIVRIVEYAVSLREIGI